MKRSYLALFASATALAFVVSMLARHPLPEPRHEAAVAAPVAAAITLSLDGGRIEPGEASVPKGAVVALRVVNRGGAPVTLALGGYEDRVPIPVIAPGAEWRGSFTADRPGADFAWLLDGRPAGRLMVTGSHLVDGHR